MSKKLQVLNSYSTFEYTPDMINESREEHDGKIVLKGVLQKSETVNQNGRIYPRAILEREIRNYQKFIQENRALGEVSLHPAKVLAPEQLPVHGQLDYLGQRRGDCVPDLNDGEHAVEGRHAHVLRELLDALEVRVFLVVVAHEQQAAGHVRLGNDLRA